MSRLHISVCSSEVSYIAVPPEIWEWLHKTFGGGPCIPRYCLETGTDNEVFDIPLTVYVLLGKRHAKLRFPRHLEFDTFRNAAENALKIPAEDRAIYHIVSEDLIDLTAQANESAVAGAETLDSLNIAVRTSILQRPQWSALPTTPSGPCVFCFCCPCMHSFA